MTEEVQETQENQGIGKLAVILQEACENSGFTYEDYINLCFAEVCLLASHNYKTTGERELNIDTESAEDYVNVKLFVTPKGEENSGQA